jgi:hypothetical protein
MFLLMKLGAFARCNMQLLLSLPEASILMLKFGGNAEVCG